MGNEHVDGSNLSHTPIRDAPIRVHSLSAIHGDMTCRYYPQVLAERF